MKNLNRKLQNVGSFVASVGLAALIILPVFAAPANPPPNGSVTPNFDSLNVGQNNALTIGNDGKLSGVNASLSGTLGVTGASTLSDLNAANIAGSGTLTIDGKSTLGNIIVDKNEIVSKSGIVPVKIASNNGLVIGDYGFYFEGGETGKMYKLANKSGNDCLAWGGQLTTLNGTPVCEKEVANGGGGGGGDIVAPWTLKNALKQDVLTIDGNGDITNPQQGTTKILNPLEVTGKASFGQLVVEANGMIHRDYNVPGLFEMFNLNNDGVDSVKISARENNPNKQSLNQAQLLMKSNALDLGLGFVDQGGQLSPIKGSGVRLDGNNLNIQGGAGGQNANLNLSFDQNKNAGIFTFDGSLVGKTNQGLMVGDALTVSGISTLGKLQIQPNGDISNSDPNQPVNFNNSSGISSVTNNGTAAGTFTGTDLGINVNAKSGTAATFTGTKWGINVNASGTAGAFIGTKWGIDASNTDPSGGAGMFTGVGYGVWAQSDAIGGQFKGKTYGVMSSSDDQGIGGGFRNLLNGISQTKVDLATPSYAIDATGPVKISGHLNVMGGIGKYKNYSLSVPVNSGATAQAVIPCPGNNEVPVSCGYLAAGPGLDIFMSYLDLNTNQCTVKAKNPTAQAIAVQAIVTCFNSAL